MAKKQRNSEGVEVDTQEPLNPFEADYSNISPEFNFDALIEKYQNGLQESDKKKIAITERIEKQKQSIARIQAFIENLEFKQKQESSQAWINTIVKPVVAELQKVFPAASVEMTTSMGIGTAVLLTVSKKGLTPIRKMKGEDTLSLTITQLENGDLGIRNWQEDTGEYPKNSVGYLNGLGHPVIPVPRHEIFQTLVSWLK